MELTSSSDLDIEELAHKKALRQSVKVLVAAIVQSCEWIRQQSHSDNGKDDDALAGVWVPVLTWLLKESPQVIAAPGTDSSNTDAEVGSSQESTPEILLSSLMLLDDVHVEQALLQLPPTVLENLVAHLDSGESSCQWPCLQDTGKLQVLSLLAQLKAGQRSLASLPFATDNILPQSKNKKSHDDTDVETSASSRRQQGLAMKDYMNLLRLYIKSPRR